MAPKGQTETQVSQPVQISGLTRTLTDDSLKVFLAAEGEEQHAKKREPA
jgi:hypothetical protein